MSSLKTKNHLHVKMTCVFKMFFYGSLSILKYNDERKMANSLLTNSLVFASIFLAKIESQPGYPDLVSKPQLCCLFSPITLTDL